MRGKKILIYALSAAFFLMCSSSAVWAASQNPFSLDPDYHEFLVLGGNIVWTASSSIIFNENVDPDFTFGDYKLGLAADNETDTKASVTIGGMKITLDVVKRKLLLNGTVDGDTIGNVRMNAVNRNNNAISFDVYLSVTATSADSNGTAIDGGRLAIYDSDGNLQDKSTYIVPGRESRLRFPIINSFNDDNMRVVVRDPSGGATLIPNTTTRTSAARGSDGFSYNNSYLEIKYTPATTGAYYFDVYYKQPQNSSRYYRQIFHVDGEIPGGKEGDGCDSGTGALAVLTALPVLLGIRRKKRR